MPKKENVAVCAALFTVLAVVLLTGRITTPSASANDPTAVFMQPKIDREAARLQLQSTAAFAGKNYKLAESLTRRTIVLRPDAAAPHYNLACAQARTENPTEAMRSLHTALKLGFRNPDHLKNDPDLNSLHSVDGWSELLQLAAAPPLKAKQHTVKPALIQNRVALVGEANTAWDSSQQRFFTFFRSDQQLQPVPVIAKGDDNIAQLLNTWQDEGTAVGLSGVLYDNHDRDHSNIDMDRFPQLTRIEYTQAAASQDLDNGLQHRMHFNATTFGNSSTSLVGGPFWRSQPRLAFADSPSMSALAFQYFRNHLYVYPEHKDYDPGLNGDGGYGDTFPANTPYVIVSQGSSYKDQAFLSVIASTLAAFHPDAFKLLEKNGLVFPCVQMIMRRCLKSVASDADYLSGVAHPPVFDGSQLDVARMIEMAHAMQPQNLPPVATISVLHENLAVVGKDYFDVGPREALFTTPAAIARICRSINQTHRMTIDTRSSRDVNGLPLTWHWIVLQGDSDRIEIQSQNDQQSVATISVKHHDRRSVRPNSEMESSRVDIGIFAYNGTYYSPPAIISLHWPEDEQRVYDAAGNIQSVEYTDHASGGNYADPLIITPKKWKDVYHYSKSGQLAGWTRIRGMSEERFTANGALVLTTDEKNRPLTGRSVRYIASPRPGQAPILKQVAADQVLQFEYDSDDDEIGHVQP